MLSLRAQPGPTHIANPRQPAPPTRITNPHLPTTGVTKGDLAVAEESLKAEISRQSQCVFSIDGNNHDLGKTKEAAMMYI